MIFTVSCDYPRIGGSGPEGRLLHDTYHHGAWRAHKMAPSLRSRDGGRGAGCGSRRGAAEIHAHRGELRDLGCPSFRCRDVVNAAIGSGVQHGAGLPDRGRSLCIGGADLYGHRGEHPRRGNPIPALRDYTMRADGRQPGTRGDLAVRHRHRYWQYGTRQQRNRGLDFGARLDTPANCEVAKADLAGDFKQYLSLLPKRVSGPFCY